MFEKPKVSSVTDTEAVIMLNNGNRIAALHQSNPNPE